MGSTCHICGVLVGTGLMMTAASAPAGGEGAQDLDQPVGSAAGATAPAEITEGAVGHLVNSSGRPVADAQIAAQSLDQPARPVPEIAILSDAQGRFVWRLRPGRYRLAAIVDGREVAAATMTVAPGRVTTVELSAAR
jgi:hypothetical protein